MKAKVTLTHSVTLFVEADSEEALVDWMNETTPEEAKQQAKAQTGNLVEENYNEQIECFVVDDAMTDLCVE